MRQLPDECIDLIYLDPPFNSNQFYVAAFGDKGMVARQLRDIWRWTAGTQRLFDNIEQRAFRNADAKRLLDCLTGVRLQAGDLSDMAAYIVYMGVRLAEMRRVLKKTGSIYLHCDPHANAYLRILMDAVFGPDKFQAQIVWRRTFAHNDKMFGAVSDYLLWYGTEDAPTRNTDEVRIPFTDDELQQRYPYIDSRGRYVRDNLMAAGTTAGESGKAWKGCNPTAYGRHWSAPKTGKYAKYLDDVLLPGYLAIDSVHGRLDVLDDAGFIHWTSGGVPLLKRYLMPKQGKVPGDIWHDVPPLARKTKERLGYPTQKPLALLERIIKASSNPGDIVMDPFCGCGTAADAAAALGRKYLGIDISGIAVRVMQQRLESRGESVAPVVYGLRWTDFEWKKFEERALMQRDDSEDGTPGWAWAEDKVAALLNAVPNQRKVGDGGVDARYFGAMDTSRNESIIIPIQVKMHSNPSSVGRPDMDRLLGAQTALNNSGKHAPMSIMVSLYPPSENLRTFAAQQGRVTLTTSDSGAVDYPVMQVLSVQEMLVHGERPKLPPVDPRSLVGDTQDRMLMQS